MPDMLESIADGVAVLTLNRPDAMNALSREMLQLLLDSLARLSTAEDVGCIVLRGAGNRAFCAGGDVKAMAAGMAPFAAMSREGKIHDLRRRMEVSRLLHEMPTPTIGMINGVAAGAGLSLALACDMRIAARSARMTTAFVNVGFSGDFGGKYFMQRIVGPAKTRELYFTSPMLDSTELDRLGLVNRVVDDDRLEAETMAMARKIAVGPRVAYIYMKRDLGVAESGTLAELLDSEAIGQIRTGETEDHREAALAFVEKRPPVFHGR
jgi:2-(1,2-epoxy-1,2-dihydrophenyl)acetyl-CoA isomerase